MKIEQIITNKIIADEGMILTDRENYGRVIFLASDRDISEFREITEDEYNQIQKEKEEELLN